MGYVIVAFLCVFVLACTALLWMFYREVLGRRLSSVLTPLPAEERPATVVGRLAQPLGLLAASIQRIVPRGEREASALRHRLVRAGFRGDTSISVLYAAKAVVPVLLCVVATSTGLYHWNWLMVYGTALGIGYVIPDYVLDHLIKAREREISRGLPDLLDLLVVCLEAGLSLDQALLRAIDEMRPNYLAIADEFGLVLLEVRAGRSRAEAWRGLPERNDLEALRTLASILIQSDQFGTGVSRTLRTHAETMRTRRRQYVEELAAKTPVKLLFPLVFFVFPLLLVVILGPAFITISAGFKL